MVTEEDLRKGMRVVVRPEGRRGEVIDTYREPDGPRVLVWFDRDPDDVTCHCGCQECCPDALDASWWVTLDRLEVV